MQRLESGSTWCPGLEGCVPSCLVMPSPRLEEVTCWAYGCPWCGGAKGEPRAGGSPAPADLVGAASGGILDNQGMEGRWWGLPEMCWAVRVLVGPPRQLPMDL